MNRSEVLKLLEAKRNSRGEANWKKLNKVAKLKSYGIGLTQLRKLAKQIGRDHELALELWKSDYYDAKVISLLIDEPKAITMDQVEMQADQLEGGYLAHVFSSCDATLAKTGFVVEIIDKWIKSEDPIRRSCAYGLLYETSKSKKKTAPDEDYFLDKIKYVDTTYSNEKRSVLLSMGGALIGIGKRSKSLNKAALKLAKKIGPIEFDKTGKCDPLNVEKHLTSDYLKNKLGI